MMLSVLAAALLLAGTPGDFHAQQADPAAMPSKDDKIVCRRVENTGWRLQGAKVCKTARQWAQRAREEQKAAEDWGSISGRMRCYGCGN